MSSNWIIGLDHWDCIKLDVALLTWQTIKSHLIVAELHLRAWNWWSADPWIVFNGTSSTPSSQNDLEQESALWNISFKSVHIMRIWLDGWVEIAQSPTLQVGIGVPKARRKRDISDLWNFVYPLNWPQLKPWNGQNYHLTPSSGHKMGLKFENGTFSNLNFSRTMTWNSFKVRWNETFNAKKE